ncbi:tetratricopeptide repeat protein, partial [Geomonas sp.]|uniref:tetratricopeptide repeat protein n=1 Tax=Geomonas sp. TaxID=2651584 RepID=UPI002B4A58BC
DQASEQAESAIVADFQRSHRNVISLRIAAAHGRHAGVDLAVRMASGRFITVLDAADRMSEDAYRLLSAALEQHPEAMMAYGDTCFTTVPHECFANHTSYGKMMWPDYNQQQLARASEVAPHPMWRRELHDTVGGFAATDDGLHDLMLRTAARFSMLHVPSFTGLQLFAGETGQHSATAAAQHQHREAPPQQAAAPQPAKISMPQPTPEQNADEAYLQLQHMVNGDDQQQAAQALERHLECYPGHAVAHNDLAATYYRLGEKERSLSHYRRAVELSPEESTYQKNLADMLYVETGEVNEAIGIYLELHRKDPRDVETLLNLGIISVGVGQPEEAESFLQRALEIGF